MTDQQDYTQQPHSTGNGAAGGEQQASEEATRNAGNEADEASRRVLHAGEAATDEGSRRVLHAGAKAGEELADARHKVASIFDTAARLAQQNSGDGTGWIVDLRSASRNMKGMLQTNAILVTGLQSAWMEWLDYSRRSIERNAKGMGDLVRSRSMSELISRQSDLLRANIEDWLHSSISLCELSADAARQAAEKVKEQAQA